MSAISRIDSRIISILVESSRRTVSLEQLEAAIGLDKNAIRAAIEELRQSGVQIDDDGGKYTLFSLPDIILPPVLHAGLKSHVMGAEIHCYRTVGSTNETARRLAESGAPEGTLVIAEKQTRGRGRLGRSWHSPIGLGLYFSLVLRPQLTFLQVPALSYVSALAICRTIEQKYRLEPQIKWPNDCLINGKKVAGILVELSAELDRIGYAVLGIGINVNAQATDFPLGLRGKAGSLAIEVGQKCNRVEFLQQLLYEFERAYLNFQRYGFRFIGPELVKRSLVINKKVSLKVGARKIVGMALGFDENGGLRIMTKDGVKTVTAGEISIL